MRQLIYFLMLLLGVVLVVFALISPLISIIGCWIVCIIGACIVSSALSKL